MTPKRVTLYALERRSTLFIQEKRQVFKKMATHRLIVCWSIKSINLFWSLLGIMDQFQYLKILGEVILSYAEEEKDLTIPNTPSCFQMYKIDILEWACQSLDCSLLEIFWVYLRKMLFLWHKPRNSEELWNVVWNTCSQEPGVDSMKNRCGAVLRNCCLWNWTLEIHTKS